MQILLIRHGRTALGAEGRYQGSLDTPLSESGRQALKPDDRFARVHHSPLLRAAETAQILFPGAERISVPDLREMDFGAFEGRGWWEMEHDAAYRAWVDGGCIGQCPGGEGMESFSTRVQAVMEKIIARARAENASELVIVAHGGTQMAALARWGFPRRGYFRWQTPCGSGWLLEDTNWPNRLDVLKEICFTK